MVASIGLLPAPNLKTATFFTPGRPALPPTLRHLGRWPTTGADQPPASKESQAGWGQQKGLSSEGEADFPIFFRRTFDYSAGGLQTHMELTHRCPISWEVQAASSYPPLYR